MRFGENFEKMIEKEKTQGYLAYVPLTLDEIYQIIELDFIRRSSKREGDLCGIDELVDGENGPTLIRWADIRWAALEKQRSPC